MVGPDGDLTTRQFSTGLKITTIQNWNECRKEMGAIKKGNKAGQRSIVGVRQSHGACPSVGGIGPVHRRVIAIM